MGGVCLGPKSIESRQTHFLSVFDQGWQNQAVTNSDPKDFFPVAPLSGRVVHPCGPIVAE